MHMLLKIMNTSIRIAICYIKIKFEDNFISLCRITEIYYIVSLFPHCNTVKSIKMVQIVINNIQIIQ